MTDYFLADDLSGALDAAAAFHRAGRRVRIVLRAEAWTVAPGDEVVGITTETRNAAPDVAAAVVTRAIMRGRELGARLVYKKIDSTLRGAVGAELQALSAALPEARLLFAPANPSVGRTVERGILRVRGVPVAETEFGRDPVSPVRESEVRAFASGVRPGRLIVPDTSTVADLDAAVARMMEGKTPWVAIGSGALAGPVAERLFARESRGVEPPGGETGEPPAAAGRLAFVGGSAHPANRTQAALLAAELSLPLRDVRAAEPAAATARALDDVRAHGATLLLAEMPRRESDRMLAAVTESCVAVVAEAGVRRLFVTGGETAFALCAALGISDLVYEREVEAGLGIARAVWRDESLRLAVKPGGFGDERTWCRAHAALTASL